MPPLHVRGNSQTVSSQLFDVCFFLKLGKCYIFIFIFITKGESIEVGNTKSYVFCFFLVLVLSHVFISSVDEEMGKVLIKLCE